ncbi:hypothetical protein ACQZV8_11440 [Magnetococcales bacterium HHB-1]
MSSLNREELYIYLGKDRWVWWLYKDKIFDMPGQKSVLFQENDDQNVEEILAEILQHIIQENKHSSNKIKLHLILDHRWTPISSYQEIGSENPFAYAEDLFLVPHNSSISYAAHPLFSNFTKETSPSPHVYAFEQGDYIQRLITTINKQWGNITSLALIAPKPLLVFQWLAGIEWKDFSDPDENKGLGSYAALDLTHDELIIYMVNAPQEKVFATPVPLGYQDFIEKIKNNYDCIEKKAINLLKDRDYFEQIIDLPIQSPKQNSFIDYWYNFHGDKYLFNPLLNQIVLFLIRAIHHFSYDHFGGLPERIYLLGYFSQLNGIDVCLNRLAKETLAERLTSGNEIKESIQNGDLLSFELQQDLNYQCLIGNMIHNRAYYNQINFLLDDHLSNPLSLQKRNLEFNEDDQHIDFSDKCKGDAPKKPYHKRNRFKHARKRSTSKTINHPINETPKGWKWKFMYVMLPLLILSFIYCDFIRLKTTYEIFGFQFCGPDKKEQTFQSVAGKYHLARIQALSAPSSIHHGSKTLLDVIEKTYDIERLSEIKIESTRDGKTYTDSVDITIRSNDNLCDTDFFEECKQKEFHTNKSVYNIQYKEEAKNE